MTIFIPVTIAFGTDILISSEIDYIFFMGHLCYLILPVLLGSMISIPIRCYYPHISNALVIILRLFSFIYFGCVLTNAFLANIDLLMIPYDVNIIFVAKVNHPAFN